MKHVAIVGSRSRTDVEAVERVVATLASDAVVVSGGADGPDTWAEHAAQRRGLSTRIFRPNLKDARTQGQRTRRYHHRNQQIVDAVDEIFALVSDDRTGGTEDTIKRAVRKGIRVTLL